MLEPEPLTAIHRAVDRGDSRAAAELVPLLYSELHRLAHSLMRRNRQGVTLQTTAIVHEAYVRLVGDVDPGWYSRGQFVGAAALAMRQILVDQARRHASL